MTIYGSILPGAASIAYWSRRTDSLTAKAKYRLKMLDWHRAHGNNVSLTARRFGMTRTTIRSWRNRFQEGGVIRLNDKSRRPKHLRKPVTPTPIVIEIVKLKREYPAWSKYKIKKLLSRKGIAVSASTIGRVFRRFDLISKKISAKRRRAALRPRARFPRGMRISQPGDMVQMDTKYVNLVGGRRIYQFTAIDILTKQRVLKYYPFLSSTSGADFLRHCLKKFRFPIKTVQTDNGSEFMKYFDQLCRKKKLPHYYIYPRTPKQNTYVETSHGADKKEFYQQGAVGCDIGIMQERIMRWENVWNNIRPHQALNYLTPSEYFLKWKKQKLPTKDVITLQT